MNVETLKARSLDYDKRSVLAREDARVASANADRLAGAAAAMLEIVKEMETPGEDDAKPGGG